MSRGLLAARSHLAFLLGLALALALVWIVNRTAAAVVEEGGAPVQLGEFDAKGDLAPRATAPLTQQEQDWARAAWSYFERNTDPTTGLAGSVEGYPSTTMWDTGSQLLATLAALDLGLIAEEDAVGRLGRAVESLARMPLCEGRAPNKAYDVRSLAMVDYGNTPAPAGIGWSAIDIARLGVPLAVIAWRFPQLTPKVRDAIARWDPSAFINQGALQGTTRQSGGGLQTFQEGRLGYEQYAARSLAVLGFPVGAALEWLAHLQVREVDGVKVPIDSRHPAAHGGAHNPVLSEPWILAGLEFGFDDSYEPMARAVLLAQERRFERTGKVTAVSEDHLDRDPRFVYSTILNGDDAWAVFTPDGKPAPDSRILSSKAAIAWGALFAGAYPDRLLTEAGALASDHGFWTGRYEASGELNRVLAANTNAVILEALAYRALGPRARLAHNPGESRR